MSCSSRLPNTAKYAKDDATTSADDELSPAAPGISPPTSRSIPGNVLCPKWPFSPWMAALE